MNPLRKMLDSMRRPAERPADPPLRVSAPQKSDAPSHCDATRLALATDKRRLERLLRDHGMTRQQAANLVYEYFRKAAQ